jgi:hypothetical protein
LVVKAGFPVVATSSGAVAATLGYEDDDSMPVEEAFGVVARIARSVPVPVTADIEAGYGLSPEDLIALLLEAGAVGCNLEDTDHHGGGGLVDARRAGRATSRRSSRRDPVTRRRRPERTNRRPALWRGIGASCSRKPFAARGSTSRREPTACSRSDSRTTRRSASSSGASRVR